MTPEEQEKVLRVLRSTRNSVLYVLVALGVACLVVGIDVLVFAEIHATTWAAYVPLVRKYALVLIGLAMVFPYMITVFCFGRAKRAIRKIGQESGISSHEKLPLP